MKTCTKCSEQKPLEDFPRYSRSKDGRAAKCNACQRIYYAQNKERISAQVKAKNAADPTSNRERVRRWQKENRERKNANNRKWVANNYEKMKQTRRRWVENNPAKADAICARRRCAMILATPAWADKQAILAIYEESERLTRETGIKHNVDHIVPLKSKHVCGLHCEFNLRAIPEMENFRKGNKFKPGYQA